MALYPVVAFASWSSVMYQSSLFSFSEPLSNYEVLLVSTGEGNRGKTSLLKCFKKYTTHTQSISKKLHQNMKRKKPPSTVATDGIQITEWDVKVQAKEKETESLSFSAWDFAGQVEYTCTHESVAI